MRQEAHGGSSRESRSQFNQAQIQPESSTSADDFKRKRQKDGRLYQLHQIRIRGKGPLTIECFRLHIEHLWNAARREPLGRTIDLKKTEHSDSLNIQFSIIN